MDTLLEAVRAFGLFFLFFLVLPAILVYLGKGIAHAAKEAWRDLRAKN